MFKIPPHSAFCFPIFVLVKNSGLVFIFMVIGKSPDRRILFLLLLPLLLSFLPACTTDKDFVVRERARYATRFLGPDGSIIEDPRAHRPPEHRERESGRREAETATLSYVPHWEWNEYGASGPPSILIRLGEQKAYFRRGDTIVGTTDISTGREGYRTPTGSFRVTQKSRNHVSNLYGDYVDSYGNIVVPNVGIRQDPRPAGTRFRGASMPYFLRIHGAVGLHAGYLPGYPASAGCIRLPREAAALFHANVSNGTPVTVAH